VREPVMRLVERTDLDSLAFVFELDGKRHWKFLGYRAGTLVWCLT
jgi:hypothetical protein